MPEENEQPKTPKSSHSTLKLAIGLIILAICIHVIRSCNKSEDTDYSSAPSTPITAPVATPSAAQDANINEQQKELAQKQVCNNLEMTHINQVTAESQTPLYSDGATDDHIAREKGNAAAYEDAKRAAGCN